MTDTHYRLEPVVDPATQIAYAWNIEVRADNLWTIHSTFTNQIDAVCKLRVLVTGKENNWNHRGNFGFSRGN